MTNGVWDYLKMAFRPDLPSIDHVTINSSANAKLALRCGDAGTVMPKN